MKENVLIQPTGMTYSTSPLFNVIDLQKAQNFLDILVRLPFIPTYIHKLHLTMSIDKGYYNTLQRESAPRNKAKIYEEYIGINLTKYTYSPNGTVEVAVRSSNSPFKLETDDDVNILFSFFGQVRDRMLYHLSDPRERVVPPIIYWRLTQCDLNKDIEITEKMQFTLPDIQLRYGGRVFREYVKLFGDVYTNEKTTLAEEYPGVRVTPIAFSLCFFAKCARLRAASSSFFINSRALCWPLVRSAWALAA